MKVSSRRQSTLQRRPTAETEHYAFKVVGDGETRIIAKYARSWETNPDDLEYICRVTVKDGKITMMMIDDEQTDSLISMLTDSSIVP